METTLLIGVAALLAISTAAHAAYNECAVVLKAPDRFLALREKPTARSELRLKLHRGKVLEVDKSVKAGQPKWTWVKTLDEVYVEETGDAVRVDGYVASRYIQRFQCPDAADGIGD